MLPHPQIDWQNRYFFSPAFHCFSRSLIPWPSLGWMLPSCAKIPRFFAMEASNSFLSLTFQRVGGPRSRQKVGPGLDGPVMLLASSGIRILKPQSQDKGTVSYGTFGGAKELDVIAVNRPGFWSYVRFGDGCEWSCCVFCLQESDALRVHIS